MSKRRKLAVRTVCIACLIPFVHQHFFVNPEIQSPTPQQQQPSVPIAETNIDSGFDRVEEALKKPFVGCVIVGLINNHKTSNVLQCVMSASGNNSL
jgi:hypothetical protein